MDEKCLKTLEMLGLYDIMDCYDPDCRMTPATPEFWSESAKIAGVDNTPDDEMPF